MITLRQIAEATATHRGVSLHALRSKCSVRKVARSRHICYALARKLTDHTLREIADFFGRPDHTGVCLYSYVAEDRHEEEIGELVDILLGVELCTNFCTLPNDMRAMGYTHNHGVIT